MKKSKWALALAVVGVLSMSAVRADDSGKSYDGSLQCSFGTAGLNYNAVGPFKAAFNKVTHAAELSFEQYGVQAYVWVRYEDRGFVYTVKLKTEANGQELAISSNGSLDPKYPIFETTLQTTTLGLDPRNIMGVSCTIR